MINIGFGVTVLNNETKKKHLDGIGIYSKELFHALQKHPLIKLHPLGFGRALNNSNTINNSYLLHILPYLIANKKQNLKDPKINIFHATDHYIPALENTLVIATVMDLIPFLHPEWVSSKLRGLKNYGFKKLIKSADHIITISQYSKNDLVNYMGIKQEKISVTHLGVNKSFFARCSPTFYQKILKKHKIKPGFFLFIGTLQPRKNLIELIDAHALLPLELQTKHQLVLVGQNGWGTDELINKIKEGESKDTVKWLKHLPQQEVQALLQLAQALVFVSLFEGFGLPVLEAFASQCPVIASNTTSIPEVAGTAALLVNPQDKLSINAAMQRLINDPTLAEQLRNKGLKQAKQFTWDQCAAKTIEVYKKLSSNP